MAKLKNIVILIPKGDLVLTSISGTYKLLKTAIEKNGNNVQLLIAGETKQQRLMDDLFTISPHLHFNEIKKADLIILPSIKSNISKVLANNFEMLSWIEKQYKKGAHLASLCTGSFFLAEAGLLNQRRCTTHWLFAEQFQSRYENVQFCKNNIITEENRIFTSGGAFSFLSLIIYLVERFFGKEIAKVLIGYYQIDYHRQSQDQFVLFETQKNHNDTEIIKAQQFIEKNYSQKITNELIAKKVNLSPRTLARRFKNHSGNTPNRYLQRVRIEAAKDFLSTTNRSIGEIQYLVGYNDPKTFRVLFSKYTGISPLQYRRKYNR